MNFKEIKQILSEATTAKDRVVKGAKPGELFTDFNHPKGFAVVTGKGKVVRIYKTERAARKHATTGEPVEESVVTDEDKAVSEATLGKPETMAQKHMRMLGYDGQGGTDYAFKSQKRYLAFVQEVAKDWRSGDMALSRMESLVTTELAWLMHGPSFSGATDPDSLLLKALSVEFRKQVKSAGLEPTTRLGKGRGFNPSMGKITINQIGQFFDLVVDFVKNDWPKIEAKVKGNP